VGPTGGPALTGPGDHGMGQGTMERSMARAVAHVAPPTGSTGQGPAGVHGHTISTRGTVCARPAGRIIREAICAASIDGHVVCMSLWRRVAAPPLATTATSARAIPLCPVLRIAVAMLVAISGRSYGTRQLSIQLGRDKPNRDGVGERGECGSEA
jgi:hypothetical protein